MNHEKLTAALEPLGRGVDVDGEPIDLALIAARTHAKAAIYTRRIREGQLKSLQRERERGDTFKGSSTPLLF